MLKVYFTILAFLSITSFFFGQKNKGVKTLNDIPEEFHNEITVGVTTNTNSALIGGFTLKYLRQINDKWYHAFGAEIVSVKNHKEQKFASYQTGNNFILGKLNHLYSVRLQYGKEIMLFGKYPEDGVRVSANLMGGLTVGFVKPYFIEYDYSTINGPEYRIEAYDPRIHENVTRILGKGGFFYGFDQMKVKPGVNLKAALNFEFGTGELLQSVTGLEVGFNFEAFAQEIPIFEVGNKRVFTSLFCIVYIGSRY